MWIVLAVALLLLALRFCSGEPASHAPSSDNSALDSAPRIAVPEPVPSVADTDSAAISPADSQVLDYPPPIKPKKKTKPKATAKKKTADSAPKAPEPDAIPQSLAIDTSLQSPVRPVTETHIPLYKEELSPDPLEQAVQDVASSAGKPLSLKRKVALGLLGGGVAAGGNGIYFNSKLDKSSNAAASAVYSKDFFALEKANKDISANTNVRNASYGISIGSFALAAVLWFLPED